jgi:hypothetical protein
VRGDNAKKPKRPRTRLTNEAVKAIADLLSGQLEKDSPEEMDALRAVSWCFRNPASVDPAIWIMLVWAVDPDLRDSVAAYFEIRRSRSRGRQKVNDREIAEFIWRRVKEAGWKRDAAYEEAVEKFKVNYKTAYNAIKKWEPIYEKFGSRLKMLTRSYPSSALDGPTSDRKKPK